VTELRLSNNQIGAAGAQAIAEALKANTTVTKLNLDGNQINDTTLQALNQTVNTNKALLTTHFPTQMTSQILQTLITTNFQSIPTPRPPAHKLQHAAIYRAVSLLKEKKEPLAVLRPLAESIRQLFGQHPALPSFDRMARSLFSADTSRHALVIGNNYEGEQSKLPSCLNDARAMAQRLRDLHFTVTLVEEATLDDLKEAV
jgi:hypothetical protein